MACSTRSRVVGCTRACLVTTRETVDLLTPARRATSTMETATGSSQSRPGVNPSPILDQKIGPFQMTTLPWTILIMATWLFISFVIGVLLGLIAAYKRASKLSNVIAVVSAIEKNARRLRLESRRGDRADA